MERLDEGAPGTGSEKDDIGEPCDDGISAPDGGGGAVSIDREEVMRVLGGRRDLKGL